MGYRKRRRPQPPTLQYHSSGQMSESGAYSNLEFLAKSPSKMMINLQVDADGFCLIDKKLIHANHNFLTVVASDNETWSIRTATLVKNVGNTKENDEKKEKEMYPEFGYSEVRLFPGLNKEKHFTEQREIVLLLDENDRFKVTNFKQSQCEIYETLRNVHSLFTTLSRNSELETFSFLLFWNDLSEEK